jgi:hypothetical protein
MRSGFVCTAAAKDAVIDVVDKIAIAGCRHYRQLILITSTPNITATALDGIDAFNADDMIPLRKTHR